MSDFEKAAKDAVDAAANSEQLALIAAVLQAQQLTQQPPAPAPAAAPSSGNTAKWVGIGAAVMVGGPLFLLAFTAAALGIATLALSVAILALVLRSIWQDIKPK
ncbi:hypothetical protein GTY83_19055 [Streptomyces sp. SID4928]|uniref:hypothetical protein n=1 Tax=unclassified Streptomyces TaxID=2593676 RepID=UPI0001C1A586|nr:hypothetical protein [Streptomyces sp. ACT-1]EGE43172.1 hypothetical protein SACT1_3840 [Streptomyces sp. ACT-1]MYR51209.1 hypothetical protein [Streptomyces sp. SID4928]